MHKVVSKIRSFRDLIVWQEAHKLTLNVYKLTKKFPKEEVFGLTNQIKRSSVSVGANIAEGFSRLSPKEKIQFYSIALGSLTETENHLLIAKDLEYISIEDFRDMEDKTILINKLCNGLIKSIRQEN